MSRALARPLFVTVVAVEVAHERDGTINAIIRWVDHLGAENRLISSAARTDLGCAVRPSGVSFHVD